MPIPPTDAGPPVPTFQVSAAEVTMDAYASFASQYVYRGVALRDRPTSSFALSTGTSYGWFVDLWSGLVDGDAQGDYASPRNNEWDLDSSVGYGAALDDNWLASLALARIIEVGDGDGASHDYNEWRASVFYRDVARGQFAYSEDYFQRGWSSWNAELSGSHALTDMLSGEWGFGRSHGSGRDDNDYSYAWLGVYGVWWHTQWDARWVDSSHGARYVLDSGRAGNHLMLSVSWALHLLP